LNPALTFYNAKNDKTLTPNDARVLIEYGAPCRIRTYDHILHHTIAFATTSKRLCALDYPFTIAIKALGRRRLVSTPSQYYWAWLGIANLLK